MCMYYHPNLIKLNKGFLKELDFKIIEYNDGIKYSIAIEDKGFLMFDDKRMFLHSFYYYQKDKISEIIFYPFDNNEFNCSSLVLKDGINSKLSKFVNVIFRKAIEKKLNINGERYSTYTFDNKCISELPSIDKYTLYKWKNIYNIISSNPFSKDIISFSFEYSDNLQSAQVKFDYPLYNYLLQSQDNVIFGIKLSDSEIELFIKIYEIFIIDSFKKAFIKPIKVPNDSNKSPKFYIFVKFYQEVKEFLLKDFNLRFDSFRSREIDKVIDNLNLYIFDVKENFYIEKIEELKKLDKEAYVNELKIREESKLNLFLLKDNIMQKKKDVITQEEINKKFEKEYLNIYYQKIASYLGRKDAET